MSTHARRACFGLLVALGVALATAAPSWAGYRETVLADSPAGYWRLGEASGTSAADETANTNTGTYLNGASLGAAGALSDGTTAVSLDGSNDYVNVPNSTSLNPSSAITLEAWVKPTAGGFGTGKPVIVKGYTSHVTPYYQYALIMLDSGTYPKLIQLSLTIGGTLQQFNVTNSGWQYGFWNHIVATYDGSNMRVYRNGTQVGSRAQTGSITSYATPLDFGCFENLSKTSTYCFKGAVDEAAIYPTALSASQIQAHYAASATSPPENLTPPSISGTAGSGAVLTASPGAWSNNPTSYSYQWQRCDNAGANCAPISGAASQTYSLTASDTGSTVRVEVSAGNGAGTSPAPATAPQTATVGTQLTTRTYSSNTTWTVAGSPYILAGNITVATGATLTIQPGVIVKSNDKFRELQVNGTLSAIGTASSRITFTSLQDDSVGGDSGGDGPTSGAKGQWYRVEFGSASVSDMSYVNVRYGGYGSSNYGYGGIIVGGQSTLTVDHAEITDNKFSGIIVAGSNGHAIVERSTIARNGMGIHLLDAWLELGDGSYVTDNGTRGVDFTITTNYTGPPSTVMDSDIYANDSSGINITLDQATATARMPTGHGNNVYGNGGKGLAIFYTHLDDDWSGNFWGSDAYFFFNPAVCLQTSPSSPGKLSYTGGTGNPPSGPVDSGGYTVPPPDTTVVCGYDKVQTTPFSLYYIGGHGRVPPGGSTTGLPTEQTFGSCGGGIHALNASSCQSDPVNGATGSFVQHVSDLALPGIGLPFAFARTYNSLDTSAGALGRGWTHSYSASLTVKANGDVTLHGEDGQRGEYTKQPDGSFVGAPGARSTLVEVTGGYELTRHDQVRYAFDSSGRLQSMRERNGQGLTFAYTSGLLATITDSVGRAITLSYNGSNRLTSVALPDGRHVDYGYTSDGHLGSVTDVRGGTTSYTYESHGFLKTAVDPNQHTVFTNTYSNAGRVTQQLDALNKTTTFSWNATTQTQTATDARNHQWKDVYDKNVLVKRIDPLTNTTEYGYDADLNLTSVKDARLHTTTMSYDGRGNLLTRTPPAPFSFDEEFTYDAQNNVLTARDGRGATTSYGYDASGNLTSTTEPGTVVTLYGRDPNGLLTSITDPRGKTTSFQYDADGNLERTTTPDGSVGTALYDGSGRMSSSVEARGNAPGADPDDYRTSYTYNEADQVLTVTDPLQHTTSYTYDGVGNLRTVTDAKSRTTEYRYDAADRLDKVIAPDPAVVTDYDYDAVGNLHLRTAPGNRVTTYEYDDANRLASVLSPAAQLWTYGYDENGNRSQAVDAAGNATPADPDDGKTIYGYDNLNRLTSIDYSDATPDVGFAYDGNGNRTSMTDGAGTVAYDFDARDRLTAVMRGADAFAYEYDDASRLTKRTYPGGRVSDYTYWDDGELQTVTSNGLTTSYGYDKAGRLTSTTLPSANGYVETRAYDRAGRLENVTNARSGSTLSSASYLYDEVGNPTQVTTQDGITTYGYDLTFDRLTNVCFTASCPNPSDPKILYAYDAVGNRTSEVRPEGTTTYSYDANLSDQLVSKSGPGGTVAYEYDADGNQTRAGARTFSYDLAGRLTSTSEGSSTIAYSYDGDGIRLQASAGPLAADETNYLWDPNAGLPQLALERDGSGATLRSYLLGNDSVSMDAGGQTSYFHYDGIGSVANLTSATGETQWTYSYEPFGAARSAVQTDPQAPENMLRFAGELYDSTTGLYHLRARQYDPSNGRFLRTDPLPPAATDPYVSSYIYANGRPTVLVDPSGLGSIWALWDWAKSEFTQCTQSLACTAEWGLTLVGPGKFFRGGRALWALWRSTRAGHLGDLTFAEAWKIQRIVDQSGRPLWVVGSTARGSRRGVGSGLPIGKGSGTRSDIDYTTTSYPNYRRLGSGLPSLSQHGMLDGAHDPMLGPAIRFEPGSLPYSIP